MFDFKIMSVLYPNSVAMREVKDGTFIQGPQNGKQLETCTFNCG